MRYADPLKRHPEDEAAWVKNELAAERDVRRLRNLPRRYLIVDAQVRYSSFTEA